MEKSNRIIFVGMHNKPDKMPLCGSTKSGKLINRIIAELKTTNYLKTNLYDVDYYPRQEVKIGLATEWHHRVEPKEDDIIVLLGAEVHENFIPGISHNIIKVAHPSSKRSHVEMNEYVLKTVEKIKQYGI